MKFYNLKLAIFVYFSIFFVVIFVLKFQIHGQKSISDFHPQRPITATLTIGCNDGRLGNQLGLYATLFGLSRLNNRSPIMPNCLAKKLLPYFKISMPIRNVTSPNIKQTHKINPFLKADDRYISQNVTLISGARYPNSFTFYNFVRKEIRKEFTFRENLTDYAQNVLHEAKKSKNLTSAVFIGVHVRKGDYGSYLSQRHGRQVDADYFEKAFEYFRKRYENCVFVVCSDDINWCRKHLKGNDIFITKQNKIGAYDLATLANCNHSIICYGTFGFWAAYLAGGEVLFFDDFFQPNSWFINTVPYNVTFLPEWKGISTTPAGFWNNYAQDLKKQQNVKSTRKKKSSNK